MCTTALSCVHGGMLVVNKAECCTPLSLLDRRTSALPSPMILKSLGAFACVDTLCHDVLPGSFRAVAPVFCGNAPSRSSGKDELNFAHELGI